MSADEDHLRQLMVRATAGDGPAYRALLMGLGRYLHAYFRKRLGRLPDEVEDLVQETLLAVHDRRHTYDQNMPLINWVRAIAHYKLVDLLRRRHRHDALNDPLEEDSELSAECNEESIQAHCDVKRLLEQLPDRQRLPIQYVKLDGLSVAEAARRSGMSESAVKVAVHRGLKLLGKKMRGRT